MQLYSYAVIFLSLSNMQLSTNFRLGEFTRSDTAKRLGIENEYSSVEQVLNLAGLPCAISRSATTRQPCAISGMR